MTDHMPAITIRQEMSQSAARGAASLGRAARHVAAYLDKLAGPDGGFPDRAGRSDLYYTAFGREAMLSLGEPGKSQQAAGFLKKFGDGDGLDFVHLVCLVRCWSQTFEADGGRIGDVADPRPALLRRLLEYRSSDGGFNPVRSSARGSAYGGFLALGAFEDSAIALPDTKALAGSVLSLAAPDGGFANEPGFPFSAAPATAAAITVLRHLDVPAPPRAVEYLLANRRRSGGFMAVAMAPIADLLSTATALYAIRHSGADMSGLAGTRKFIESMLDSSGGFCGSAMDAVPDCEYTFYGLLGLGCLDAVK